MTKRMGRPPGIRLSFKLHIKLSPEQMDKLRKLTLAAGFTKVSKYVRVKLGLETVSSPNKRLE